MSTENENKILYAIEQGILMIDDMGRVWRIAEFWRSKIIPCIPRRIERPLKSGYLDINILRDGKMTHARANRIAYRYFKGDIPDGKTINHINGIKKDNDPGNLEVATMVEQRRHAIDVLGKRGGIYENGEAHRNAILIDEQVYEIRRRRATGEGEASIAKDFNISLKTVSDIATRKRWKHLPERENIVIFHDNKGEHHPNCKLTKNDVLEIRRRAESGESRKSIAKDYPVGVGAINRIVTRRTWKSV
jgi:uncharacterized protein (DUF433 family)